VPISQPDDRKLQEMKPDGIAIVGIGETPALRRSDRDIRQMAVDAIFMALDDAGIDPREVDGLVTEGMVMPGKVPHEYVGAQLGIERHFDATMSQVGAGIVGAPMLAAMAIRAGLANVVVSYFSTDWGTDLSGPYAYHDAFPAKKAFEKPYGFNGQPSYWALWTNRYMYEFGLTQEQLGTLAVLQRENAIRTGRAQMTKPMSLEGYLASPMVSDPLRVPDCCLISDGAGAFVMSAVNRARDCRKRPVNVLGVGFSSRGNPDDLFSQGDRLLTTPGAMEARRMAEKAAGVSLGDADFGELYDCFTPACLMQIEDLGLCRKGEAGHMIAEGHTRLGGRLPLNTHGGLLSYSYRLSVEHVVEAVRQLRGEGGAVQVPDAELGFVTGESFPDFSVLVLAR
jgi:acetyl-CoA acetyltransferase